jgi:hypothetical protein
MNRSSLRAAENQIYELEMILKRGINEDTGEPLTDEERDAIDMRICNIDYDIEEAEYE